MNSSITALFQREATGQSIREVIFSAPVKVKFDLAFPKHVGGKYPHIIHKLFTGDGTEHGKLLSAGVEIHDYRLGVGAAYLALDNAQRAARNAQALQKPLANYRNAVNAPGFVVFVRIDGILQVNINDLRHANEQPNLLLCDVHGWSKELRDGTKVSTRFGLKGVFAYLFHTSLVEEKIQALSGIFVVGTDKRVLRFSLEETAPDGTFRKVTWKRSAEKELPTWKEMADAVYHSEPVNSSSSDDGDGAPANTAGEVMANAPEDTSEVADQAPADPTPADTKAPKPRRGRKTAPELVTAE